MAFLYLVYSLPSWLLHRRSLLLMPLLLLSFCQSLTLLVLALLDVNGFQVFLFVGFCFETPLYPDIRFFQFWLSLNFLASVCECVGLTKKDSVSIFVFTSFPSKNRKNVIMNRKCIWIGLSCLFNLI